MNRLKYTFLIFLMLKMAGLSATVFVDASATGANDGSSWANAFTDLNTAVLSAPANEELWIAAGTYSPGNTPASHIMMTYDLKLYGGFNGTETALSQRDYQANQTILTGDVNGDDVAGDFVTNRADNNLHLIWLDAAITNNTVIDGLILQNGTTADVNGSGNDRRGGGILAFGAPTIQNCTFRYNYGFFGGGIYPRDIATGTTKIYNCTFVDNDGVYGAALLFVRSDVDVQDCTFSNNHTVEGAAVNSISAPGELKRCTFTGNSGGIYGGAGFFVYQSGGSVATVKLLFEDCVFDQNVGPDYGAAVGLTDEGVVATFNRCDFTNNNAGTSGAGLYVGFNPTVELNSCTFSNNEATQAAAIHLQDSSYLSIDSTLFEFNTASDSTWGGGAIGVFSSATSTIRNSSFQNNASGVGGGGAIFGYLYGGVDFDINVDNTYFSNNTSAGPGGAVILLGSNLSLTNCLVSGNSAVNGGAIFANADGINQSIDLTNTTLADNNSSGLAALEHAVLNNGTSVFNFLNTIVENPGMNYVGGTGTTAASRGGNLSSDGSLTSILNGTNDLNNSSAQFLDPSGGDYSLAMTSPAINTGIDAGAPTTDIHGLARVGITDKGPYEYQLPLSLIPSIQLTNDLQIFPNPVNETLHYTIENEWNGQLEVAIYDVKGALIQSKEISKMSDLVKDAIQLPFLPQGVYQLQVSNGAFSTVKQFVKQ